MNRIAEILNARGAVTGDTALRLGRFFGNSGEFWLNLQKLYELRRVERENGTAIARLPTLPIASSGEDETMESGGGGSASGDQAMPNLARKMVAAEEVLVLDSSTFIKEIGLTSRKGSALKHYLYCRGTQLAVPEAAAEEYERHLARAAKKKIEIIQKELGWLAQFCGGIGGWSAPSDDVIEDHAKALAAGNGIGAILLPETDDTRARARLRDQAEQPPSHRRAGMGDCRIWEQCLQLLSSHDVVFVAADKDFHSHRNPEELHPWLRAEAKNVGAGRSLTFHSNMETLLYELKSEIPPIPNDAIFEFVYHASRDTIQELESNSECRPTSTGTIKQTRLTTEAPDVIEVRLEVEDRWKSTDGSTSLRFELSGSCHYHLGDGRLADLKTDVVHLLTTEADGSVRAVKGSYVNLRAHAYAGTSPIPPERGRLE